MTIEMIFYCTREKDGTIHVQNAVMGMMGQHHVHTEAGFAEWRVGLDEHNIKWLQGTAPCDSGLKAGEKRSGGD